MNRRLANPNDDSFFAVLRERGCGLLALDYDGTLAPFHNDRFAARPDPTIKQAVDAIVAQGRTRVAIVTGRPAREAKAVGGFPDGIEVWGAHGFEFLDAEGCLHGHALDADVAAALDRAVERLVGRVDPARVEVKHGSVLVHWRALAPPDQVAMQALARAAWRDLELPGRLHLGDFDGGLELRAAARTKGDAIADLLARHGHGRAAAFLGDDLTDEDGFAAIDGHGLGVLVRNQPRTTRAHRRVTMPEGVAAFLWQWHDSLNSATGGVP